MRRTWRWVVGFAGFGAALTFFISLSNNPLATTALRTLYAFLAFGLIGSVVHVALSQLLRPAGRMAPADAGPSDERGAVVDLSTPEDDGVLADMLKEQWAESGKPAGADSGGASEFKPLKPQRLVSIDNPKPEEVVQAVRRMTDE
jgi:hypothetical protein